MLAAFIEKEKDPGGMEAAVRDAGFDITVYKETEAFLMGVEQVRPEAVLIDLNSFEADATGLIERLKRNPATRPIPVLAYGDSLRADLLQDAEECGADQVLPRAVFHRRLRDLLRHYQPGRPSHP